MTAATFDTKAFLEFCRSKPRDEEYVGSDAYRCALGQFGFDAPGFTMARRLGIPRPVFSAAISQSPFTFGALADRLERLVQ